MKTILTTLSAIAFTAVAFAQNPDKALAKVSYSFSHIQDTTQKDKPFTENMLLVIGKNASVYTSYDKINRQMEIQKQLQEQMKNQAGNNSFKLNVSSGSPGKALSQLDYFYFAKENKFLTKERLFNNYLVEEPLTKIPWKITKDTTSFSGIHCQKATAYFKGRNWIAWYAPELPFQSGPWKLNGLPGLIIEAYDEKKEVMFQFAGMENITTSGESEKKVVDNDPKIIGANGNAIQIASFGGLDNGNPYEHEIKLPVDAIRTTRKELDKLKEARDKDPQGFMKTQAAASGANIVINGSAAPRLTAPKNVLNNPIELPEKK